jgi:hypothetical protein
MLTVDVGDGLRSVLIILGGELLLFLQKNLDHTAFDDVGKRFWAADRVRYP